jgi:hypothetical protein
MSRLSRLKEYAKPLRAANWQGAGRDQENIDRWADRASANSELAPRARGPVGGGPPGTHGKDAPEVPRTTVRQRDSEMKPFEPRKVNARMAAKGDQNFVGSSEYMRGARRDAN